MKSQKWQSDIGDQNLIETDKINFIYDNAVSYLKELDTGLQVINTRTTLLLAYLASCVAFLVSNVFKTEPIVFKMIAGCISVEYIGIIFYIAFTLLLPRFAFATTNTPSNLLKKDVMQYELKMIKFFECELMQDRIEANLSAQINLSQAFKNALLTTFITPSISTIILLLFGYFIY